MTSQSIHSDLYTPLFSRVLLPAWERVRRRDTLELLRSLQRTQWLSTDELLAQQEADLRRLLCHSHARVPAYRRRLDEAGVDPATIRLSDLSRLPLLDRTPIRDQPGEFRAAPGGPGGPLLTKSTSGSTGAPFRFQYSAESDVWRQAVKLRHYDWAGYTPGKRTVYFWGPSVVPPTGWRARKVALDRAMRREVYIDCARQGEADLLEAVATLRSVRPQVLVGFTQATVELARFIIQRGLRDWPAMRVVCGAERLFESDRPLLEQAFAEPGGVYETYGCREFMLMASECPEHRGLHTAMENVIVEVVDEQGRPVAPGESGQVAVTDLHNFGMPLIRYLNGDLAQAPQAGASARCLCGRGLTRIAGLEGRQSDLLYGPSGQRVPGLVLNSVFAALGGKVLQFQLVQRKDRSILLKVVPGPEFTPVVLDEVRARLRTYFGDLPQTLETCADIPTLPSGKRRYVVAE